jgi:hypothetical protein
VPRRIKKSGVSIFGWLGSLFCPCGGTRGGHEASDAELDAESEWPEAHGAAGDVIEARMYEAIEAVCDQALEMCYGK